MTENIIWHVFLNVSLAYVPHANMEEAGFTACHSSGGDWDTLASLKPLHRPSLVQCVTTTQKLHHRPVLMRFIVKYYSYSPRASVLRLSLILDDTYSSRALAASLVQSELPSVFYTSQHLLNSQKMCGGFYTSCNTAGAKTFGIVNSSEGVMGNVLWPLWKTISKVSLAHSLSFSHSIFGVFFLSLGHIVSLPLLKNIFKETNKLFEGLNLQYLTESAPELCFRIR